jgi:sugar lactone lactonase YvrE
MFYESEEAVSSGIPETPLLVVAAGPLDNLFDFSLSGATSSEEMMEQALEDFTEGEISDLRNIDVGGEDAVIATVAGEEEGVEVAGSIITVYRGDNFGTILLGISTAEAWEPFQPTFEAIVESVVFFEPEIVVPPTIPPEPTTPPVGEGEEVRLWAIAATASSEYTDDSWSAMQATGEPDTPDCGDWGTAWASADSSTVEWLEVYYETTLIPTEVNIYQNYNPSQITTVELLDDTGTYHEIYTGEPEAMDDCPYILSIPVDADYPVIGVRITIDQSVLGLGWNEIDAVELVGLGSGGAVQPPTEPPDGFVWRVETEGGFDYGELGSPDGMDFGPDGLLYVADWFNGMLVLDPSDGAILSFFGEGDLWTSEDVAIAENGDIYVADGGNSAVFVYAPDGSLLLQFGEEGTGEGQFGGISPEYIDVCPNGLVYTIDDNYEEEYERVQVFDLNGNYQFEWSITDIDDFFAPAGIACDQDSNVYLSGSIGGYFMIFDEEGNLLDEIGQDVLDFVFLGALDIGPDGNIYFTTWDGYVGVMDTEGNLLATWGTEGDGEGTMNPGEFWAPDGLTVDEDGYVYVSDSSDEYVYITKFFFPDL